MKLDFLKGHPKGLYLLFCVEMWERFSYYGMRALLVLYMVQYLFAGMNKDVATQYAGNIYGWYTGLVYLTPLVGGYLADRNLGQRKCIATGTLVMSIGLFVLALSVISQDLIYKNTFFVIGLILMILANGFVKSNISAVVGMLYGSNKQKRDAGFTIFYMGINLGAFFSPLICGTLATVYGFQYGFMAAGFGVLIGFLIYKLGEKPLLQDCGLNPYRRIENKNKTEDRDLRLREKRKLWALYVLMAFSVVFWLCYEQAGCSMALFAENETNRAITLFGQNFVMPSQYFQSLNPLFIVTFAPLMSILWGVLHTNKKEPTSVQKFTIGLGLISVAYLIMAIAAHYSVISLVSPMWLVGAFFVATIAELCISPIGLSLVTKLAPVKFASLIMGCWFLSSFIGNLGAGVFAGFYEKISHSLFFLILALTSAIVCFILMLLIPLLKKWMGKS